MTLSKQLPGARHHNLVFTSVGDRSNVQYWLHGRRNFDLWMTYYGDNRGQFRDAADYYGERKGSKFQNLYFVYQQWRHLLDRYRAVFVVDDDILISGSQISRLFETRERHDLWALQPAFSARGKVSWPITRVQRANVLRYTDFIEMTCPLFRKDKLDAFMAVYDPELVGWGCDWWFLETMGHDLCGRVAVVDAIICVNPHDSTKGGREIDRLSPADERRSMWQRIKHRYRIRSEERGMHEFGSIRKPPIRRGVGQAIAAFEAGWVWLERQTGRVLRKLC
jgi:hypothetical protein